MGVCGSGDDKKKYKEKVEKSENKPNDNNIIAQDEIVEIKEEIKEETKGEEEERTKLKSIPNTTSIKTNYKLKLIDLSTNEEFENEIDSNTKIGDLIKNLKLRENGDFIIEFENNMKISNEEINKRFGELMIEIFDKDIPEVIEMKYSYKGLDIPEEIINEYIESNEIIGSAVLDNQELFCIITYEKDMKVLTPYYYKRKDNEDLTKFNLFTAFCNGKGKLYFSGGESEQEGDPDKTVAKYNNFFYVDLKNLKENKDKIIIEELPNLNESRTWHSMIYVPHKYIFIVGGSNTKSVEVYNMETNELKKDSELNEIRSESTLCLVNNMYLYAFYGFLLYQEHITTIERCNLLKGERKWEYVYINEKNGVNFYPSFFGVSYFKNDEILLIGSNDNGDEKHFDYIYKIGKNEDEKDDIVEFKCNLNENNRVFKDKFFMPINDNESVNIPLIIGEDIKIYILNTNNGEITIQNYQEPTKE